MNDRTSSPPSVSPAIRLALACAVVFGAAYPLAVLVAGKMIDPAAAEGSLVRDEDGQVIGSELIAQPFTRPEWFWPRPSAVGYNAQATGGSNLAASNPALAERVQLAVEGHRAAGDEVSASSPLPLDLALASGGGLDPDITLDAARFQAPRVARARGIPVEQVLDLVEAHAEGDLARTLTGSRPTVNVLRLNRALARLPAE
jgi:K+-transporting ATPase ATPase C chain